MKNPGPRLLLLSSLVPLLLHAPLFAQCGLERVGSDTAEGDRFGEMAAMSGDTAAVVAASHSAIYILERDQGGSDNWGETAEIDGGGSGYNPISIALDGDTLIAAPLAITARLDIFERNQGGPDAWGLSQTTNPQDSQFHDAFGVGMALSGDTAVVGAPLHEHTLGLREGAAYVFERNHGGPGNWGQRAEISPQTPSFSGSFGSAIAIDGNTLAISSANPLEVQIHERDSGGLENWGLVKTIAGRGTSLALKGDRLVVGDDGGSGEARVYERDQGGASDWGLVAVLTGSDSQNDDGFGRRVSLEGDTIVVGARLHDLGNADEGAAYVYRRDQGGADPWGELLKLTAPSPSQDDRFGSSVACVWPTVLAGAPYVDQYGDDAGAAYFFRLDGPDCDGDGVPDECEADCNNDGTPDDCQLLSLGYCYGVFCPCGNDDANAGCFNSTGLGARMEASGTSVHCADALVLTTSQLPFSPGVYFMGQAPIQLPFGDGFRCVGGLIYRFSAGMPNNGVRTLGPGIIDVHDVILPATTWYFQYWYRDIIGPCHMGFNTSNAASVFFYP